MIRQNLETLFSSKWFIVILEKYIVKLWDQIYITFRSPVLAYMNIHKNPLEIHFMYVDNKEIAYLTYAA
jgi:hypothetical protein